jgi:4-amino-4-deoxy-L-arabinose transferase-like glycosyltransferase
VQWKSLSCKPSCSIGRTPLVAHKTDINGKTLHWCWSIVAAIIFGIVLAIRIRLLGFPLERDEGEYAYAGQLMLQGIPPYKLAYNMKFPGTYAAYAAIMSIFGQTIFAVHLGLLLVNALTVALIFFIGRRLMDSTAGIAAAMVYAVLSVSPSVLGLAAHATNFVILPALGGTLLVLKVYDSGRRAFGRLFASGLLFGLAVVMKQSGAFFVGFAAIYLIVKELQRGSKRTGLFPRILVFTGGVILPFGITSLLLWRAGVFRQFWFWTIDYARQYGSIVPLDRAPKILFWSAKEVIGPNWPLWILAGVGAVVGLWNQRERANAIFLLGFLLFSALALCPGFYFRDHYFILVLPAVSLLVGAAMSKLSDLLGGRMIVVRSIPLLMLCVTLSLPILWDKKLFFDVSPIKACGLIYPENPFLESVRIAGYVREHTGPDDTIAVLGSEPEIYFYAQRHSATGYI